MDAHGVMQVSESQSTANAVVMPESSTLIIMGYAVVRDGKRLLLRSPGINVDTTSPTAGTFSDSTGVSATGFTLNWSATSPT